MLTNIACVLAALIGAAVVFLGARAFWAPQAATGFGIPGTPTDDPVFRAWLQVKGIRDTATGLFIFVLLAGTTPQVLGWFLLVAVIIPVGDTLTVLRSNGPKAAAYGIHGATAVTMAAISALLLLA
ncbi:DUF4267 domain-containing protein [Nocardia shimofusensis]|uniref:DUF4267 domain-containing protein n=1 Tax=Nocardia shimofusensis TaxID=228596 RepID=UPI0008335738|nr:DUF4267 domain-containing protein [Nocardia shimofusensis]